MEGGVSEDSVRGQFEGIVSGEGLKGRCQRKISGYAVLRFFCKSRTGF